VNNEIYLVVNAGSSSLKFSAYQMPEKKELIYGYFEKIGMNDNFYSISTNGEKIKKNTYIKDHAQAVSILLNELFLNNIITDVEEIKGVGHRVVHGGDKYSDSIIINNEVMNTIEKLVPLAPLHNPANLIGIKNIKNAIPDAVHVASFDTAFHHTIPEENYMYPIPSEWYEKYLVRKYGFHGTSYKYITNAMKYILNKKHLNLIICHIGSGASITAIKNSKSYDTTMGMTPLDGLMMGTRCGSIDPSIISYIKKMKEQIIEETMNDLNKKSGLLGITGKSDLRDVEALADNGDKKAQVALDMYTWKIADYIIQYYNRLEGNIDGIVFTAGVGENQSRIRDRIIKKISKVTGINIDEAKNNNIASYKEQQTGVITTEDSKIPVWVVPTNEELMILEDTYTLTKSINEKSHTKIKR